MTQVERARREFEESHAELRRLVKGSMLAIYRAGWRVTHCEDPLRADVVAEIEREIAAVGIGRCADRPWEGE